MAADFAAARLNMVESQVRPADVTNVHIHDAMRAIPREELVPPAKRAVAYADAVVEYAPGRFLLKPRDVAKLIQVVKAQPGERALAIAAPYAAAVLERLGLSVTRLDSEDLTPAPGEAYDVILVEGAVAKAPAAWLSSLALGGRLAVVELDGPVGRALVYVRAEKIGRAHV